MRFYLSWEVRVQLIVPNDFFFFVVVICSMFREMAGCKYVRRMNIWIVLLVVENGKG
jgi:hypothetical protein